MFNLKNFFQSVGIDKCEIPDLTKAPSSLIDALEQHLISLDGQKTSNSQGSRVGSPTQGWVHSFMFDKIYFKLLKCEFF